MAVPRPGLVPGPGAPRRRPEHARGPDPARARSLSGHRRASSGLAGPRQIVGRVDPSSLPPLGGQPGARRQGRPPGYACRVKVLSVVGTRPQLIKAAALQPALRARHDEVFVDTGQHWDESMAGSFFAELGLARPDHSLGAGGGSHGEQTAAMLVGLEPLLAAERPDVVLVYGDTNSTLAGALAAAKLGLPVAHVEAGLRSFDRRMPEELNRVVADHLAAWLLAPTPAAVHNLRAEGITRGVAMVGDLMFDLAARVSADVRDPAVLAGIGRRLGVVLAPGDYLFATIHRQENRDPAAMAAWTGILDAAGAPGRPVILALHPGTRLAMERAGVGCGPDIRIIEPQGYRTSLALQLHAAAVLTDSGGIQRESAWLGVPCLVLRASTEWTEVVDGSDGRSVVVGLDVPAATAALARLVPPGEATRQARDRASSLALRPTGVADAIVAVVEQPPVTG
ncbi:MAG: UDP-N-acetylglucosamine 2-epimerase (non-hydrolyzing) [Chloroflexota bacterium]|nr:MAG: UDP-N-acetylglucosamine 2-epimerase (non-hydrolyzing) [Chloroflexota bacterium]